MRGFVFGLILFVGFAATLLSLRPGGLRRQIRLVGRRFRIVLILGGVWTLGSLAIRLAFSSGPVMDYGPAVLAIVLLIVFLFVGRDPNPSNA